MFKILIIIVSLIGMSSGSFGAEAQPVKKEKLTWSQADLRCQNLSSEQRLQHQKTCDEARRRVVAKQKSEKYPFYAGRFFVDYSSTNYHVKDKASGAGADFVTTSNVKIESNFVFHYSPSFKSYLGLSYSNLIFDNPNSKTILNRNLDVWDFHGGVIYNPIKRLSLDLSAHYGDVYYIRGQGNDLKFSKFLVPQINLKGSFDLFTLGGIDIGLGANIGYALPFKAEHREEPQGNFDVEGNLAYGGEIYGRKQFDRWSISGGIAKQVQHVNTSQSEGRVEQVSVGVKIAIPFGWNEQDKK